MFTFLYSYQISRGSSLRSHSEQISSQYFVTEFNRCSHDFTRMFMIAEREKISVKSHLKKISLMLDIATKNHKAILGINLRYIIDGKIIERCIGMIPLTERHTSRNLAIKVKQCIDKFGITLKQLSSITTDNAGNVVAIVDYLDEETLYAIEEEASSGTAGVIEPIPSQSIEPVSEDEIRSIVQEIMEEEALDTYLDDSEEYGNLLSSVLNDLPHHFNENTANVRCGAHTLHLTVRGGIKKSNFHEVISVCEKVAKLLRNEAYVREAREHNMHYSLPHLNVITRWDSDYTMVIFFSDLFVCFRKVICTKAIILFWIVLKSYHISLNIKYLIIYYVSFVHLISAA